MKSWFAKLTIRAPRRSTRLPASPGLYRSEIESREIEQSLRTSRPRFVAPPSLHTLIMESLRSCSATNAQVRNSGFPANQRPSFESVLSAFAFPLATKWVLPTTVFVVAGIIFVTWTFKNADSQDHSSSSLYPAVAALEAGNQLAREMPPLAVAPLTDELERLTQDLEGAKQLLVASVP